MRRIKKITPERVEKAMITTVLFDMGGTLEDIWVDDKSHDAAIAALEEALFALDQADTPEDLQDIRAALRCLKRCHHPGRASAYNNNFFLLHRQSPLF